MPMNWTPERIEELRQLALEGWSASKIAAKMGVTKNAIVGQCARRQILLRRAADKRFPPADNAQPWTKEEEELLRDLTAKGWSTRKIAEEIPKSAPAIWGKQRRMRLGTSSSPAVKRNGGAVIAALKAARKREKRVGPTFLTSHHLIDPLKIPYMELRPHHCRWLLDERGEDGLKLSCGHNVMKGHSWCPTHVYASFYEFICLEAAE